MMISDCDSSVLGYIYNIDYGCQFMRRLLNYNTYNETDSRLGLLTQYSAGYKNERSRLHVSMKLKQNYIQVTRNYKTVLFS